MWRTSLISFALLAAASPALLAQDAVVSFEPLEPFEDYPRDWKPGAQGHRVAGAWFSGRWYCAAIGAGILGPPDYTPFAGGPHITEERVVAITAVDLQSKTRKCLRIAGQSQPRMQDAFHIQFPSKDRLVFVGQGTAPDRAYVAAVSLSDSTVSVQHLDQQAASERVRTIGIEVVCDTRGSVGGTPGAKVENAPRARILGDGRSTAGLLGAIPLQEPNPEERTHFIAPGSRLGRVVCLDIIGAGEFSVSERDCAPAGREYWRLSEEAVRAPSKDVPGRASQLHFPRLMIGPIARLALVTEGSDRSLTLFVIEDGRLRRLWEGPRGSRISEVEVSEDETYAALELSGTAGTKGTTYVVAELATGQVTLFQDPAGQWEDLVMTGITNRGELIQEDGASVFIRRGHEPEEVARLIGR